MSVFEELEKRLAQAIPLNLYRVLIRRSVIGLTYHSVSPKPLPHLEHIYPSKNPEAFEADLKHLQANTNLVSYDQLLDHYQGKVQLQPNSVLLTFDDGYAECYTVVRPLLHKYAIPCIFFLTTNLIDNRTMFYRNKYSLCVDIIHQLPEARFYQVLDQINQKHGQSFTDRESLKSWLRSLRHFDKGVLDAVCDYLDIDIPTTLATSKPYLTSEQVKSLAADGFTIGAHGRQHVKYNFLDEHQMEADTLSACQAIRTLTGQDSVPFSFPFSGYGVDRNYLADLRQRHAIVGLLFESTGFRKEPPFIINRVWADPPPAPGVRGSNLDRLFQFHSIQTRFQDVFHPPVGVIAEKEGALGGSFHPFFPITCLQSHKPQAGAVSLLWMTPGGEDVVDQLNG